MSNPSRIYVVGHIESGSKRLVRAVTSGQAARHAMRTSHAVTVATQDELVDLVRAGVDVEDATRETLEQAA
jgi:hypothetical protein